MLLRTKSVGYRVLNLFNYFLFFFDCVCVCVATIWWWIKMYIIISQAWKILRLNSVACKLKKHCRTTLYVSSRRSLCAMYALFRFRVLWTGGNATVTSLTGVVSRYSVVVASVHPCLAAIGYSEFVAITTRRALPPWLQVPDDRLPLCPPAADSNELTKLRLRVRAGSFGANRSLVFHFRGASRQPSADLYLVGMRLLKELLIDVSA